LARRFPGQLRHLLTPQHGFFCEQQDNMIETAHSQEPALGLTVYSLYSDQRKPTSAMLEGIEVLLVDLQDVGCRVYTFLWTLSYCLEACADRGITVGILDRPNPLGRPAAEGARLDREFCSFVGRSAIPMAHGLTLAELAKYVNQELRIGAPLEAVPMRGWRRDLHYSATGLHWIPPSPNLPRLNGVDVYPGQVLLEGTNLSEGRGTTVPFEVCGAPYIDPVALTRGLQSAQLPGVLFRPIRFTPMFGKHQNRSCGGVHLHVTRHAEFRPYRTTLVLLSLVRELYPRQFDWSRPPYEYEHLRPPIDLITGSNSVRRAIDREGALSTATLDALCDARSEEWALQTAAHRLYP
jgi:uncharacterized protein YbbC (DUF1343 family)